MAKKRRISSVTVSSGNDPALDAKLLNSLIDQGVNFDLLANPDFKSFIEGNNPNFKCPSINIANKFTEISASKYIQHVASTITNSDFPFVYLMMSFWRYSGIKLMNLNIQYYDNARRTCCIGVFKVKSFNEEAIANLIVNRLKELHLNKTVIGVTSDNSSFAKEIKKKLLQSSKLPMLKKECLFGCLISVLKDALYTFTGVYHQEMKLKKGTDHDSSAEASNTDSTEVEERVFIKPELEDNYADDEEESEDEEEEEEELYRDKANKKQQQQQESEREEKLVHMNSIDSDYTVRLDDKPMSLREENHELKELNEILYYTVTTKVQRQRNFYSIGSCLKQLYDFLQDSELLLMDHLIDSSVHFGILENLIIRLSQIENLSKNLDHTPTLKAATITVKKLTDYWEEVKTNPILMMASQMFDLNKMKSLYSALNKDQENLLSEYLPKMGEHEQNNSIPTKKIESANIDSTNGFYHTNGNKRKRQLEDDRMLELREKLGLGVHRPGQETKENQDGSAELTHFKSFFMTSKIFKELKPNQVVKFYFQDNDDEDIEYNLKGLYPNISKLAKIAAITPVTLLECDRSSEYAKTVMFVNKFSTHINHVEKVSNLTIVKSFLKNLR